MDVAAGNGRNPVSNQIQPEYGDEQAEAVDGTAEPLSRDQILGRERRQRNIHFPYYSADHEQDWQPYPVDLYSTICYDHIYIQINVHRGNRAEARE